MMNQSMINPNLTQPFGYPQPKIGVAAVTPIELENRSDYIIIRPASTPTSMHGN